MTKTNRNGGTKGSEEINNLKEKIIWFELFVDYIYHSDFKNYKKASSYANNSMTNAD